MKKCLCNVVVDGVEYEKGKIYSAEAVAHIDASNFEDVDGVAEATTEAAVQEEEITAEISEDGKKVIFSDGEEAPLVDREEVVAELGEEEVAKIENEAINADEVQAEEEIKEESNTDSEILE